MFYVSIGERLLRINPVFQSQPDFSLDAPQIHVHIQLAKAIIGERIHLNCTARGNPTPNITWYRGNQRITSGYSHVFL